MAPWWISHSTTKMASTGQQAFGDCATTHDDAITNKQTHTQRGRELAKVVVWVRLCVGVCVCICVCMCVALCVFVGME